MRHSTKTNKKAELLFSGRKQRIAENGGIMKKLFDLMIIAFVLVLTLVSSSGVSETEGNNASDLRHMNFVHESNGLLTTMNKSCLSDKGDGGGDGDGNPKTPAPTPAPSPQPSPSPSPEPPRPTNINRGA